MKTTSFYLLLFINLSLFISCDKDSESSSEPDSISGCIDTVACNYNSNATVDDSSCLYVDEICETCENGVIIDNDADNDGICDDDEVVGCAEIDACNYLENVTDIDNTLCYYALDNPIEFTSVENIVYGSVGDDTNAYINIRNASCDNNMSGLEAVRMTQNTQYFTSVEEGYFSFCFGPNCFFESDMPNNLAISLSPGEQLSDTDNTFKATIFSNVPGTFEVTYRFFLNSVQGVFAAETITFIIE